MLKKIYLKDKYKNKIYTEHYFLNEKNNKKNNKVVVILHGFLETCNLKKYEELTALLLDENFEVIKFDYTGHGKSKGIVKPEYFYSNIKKIYEYIMKNYSYKYEKIKFIAYSISGVVCLNFVKKILEEKKEYKRKKTKEKSKKQKNKKNIIIEDKKIKKIIFLNPYFGYNEKKEKKKNIKTNLKILKNLKKKFLSFLEKIIKYNKIVMYNKHNNLKVIVDKSLFEYKKIVENDFYTKKIFNLKFEGKIFIIQGRYDKNVVLESSKIAYKELSKKNNFVLLYVVEDDHFLKKTKNLVFKKILHFLKV